MKANQERGERRENFLSFALSSLHFSSSIVINAYLYAQAVPLEKEVERDRKQRRLNGKGAITEESANSLVHTRPSVMKLIFERGTRKRRAQKEERDSDRERERASERAKKGEGVPCGAEAAAA